ncbi:hypothetical protein CEXT_678221 [Caerostris extrusa]|uniref:Uncharacterized protein n=1 Tax=Caerostris extrusa TaxID=172846 RepID=A0AAV4Y918_CAEEX|nr:hypothetical protein CEXT_678221 [Caerostris extrusa]
MKSHAAVLIPALAKFSSLHYLHRHLGCALSPESPATNACRRQHLCVSPALRVALQLTQCDSTLSAPGHSSPLMKYLKKNILKPHKKRSISRTILLLVKHDRAAALKMQKQMLATDKLLMTFKHGELCPHCPHFVFKPLH